MEKGVLDMGRLIVILKHTGRLRASIWRHIEGEGNGWGPLRR